MCSGNSYTGLVTIWKDLFVKAIVVSAAIMAASMEPFVSSITALLKCERATHVFRGQLSLPAPFFELFSGSVTITMALTGIVTTLSCLLNCSFPHGNELDWISCRVAMNLFYRKRTRGHMDTVTQIVDNDVLDTYSLIATIANAQLNCVNISPHGDFVIS
ncbi:hypothetical protein Pelo_12262 [Pelomyxa schiedti]|nr:hypothetical protein Pelo_12262 [Pelomyxa schiedti]